jgi:hypothetical protein
VLCGQPELDEKLSRHGWRQLVQRISLKRYAINLTEEDTYRYLQHRIDVAEYKGPPLFSQDALKLIWEFSEGIPRKINILCDNALLIGYGLAKKKIDEEIVQEAIKDLSWSPYLNTAASQAPPPDDTLEARPEEEKTDHTREPDLPNEEKEYSSPEKIRFTDGEEIAAEQTEVLIPETLEALQAVPKPRLYMRQSSLIAGFLILVGLILIVWFFFTKPKIDLGENISIRSQTTIQTEPTGRLEGGRYRPSDEELTLDSAGLFKKINQQDKSW